MIVAYILSGLALLTAVTNIILFFVEKKRGLAQRKATLEYIDNVADGVLEEAEAIANETFCKAKDDYMLRFNSINADMSGCVVDLAELKADVKNLKSGTVPDFEAAKAAANAVNDFNAGLSAIMNFDPIAVARARRVGGDKEAD